MAIKKLPPLNQLSVQDVDEDALDVVHFMDRILERVVSVYEKARVPLPARRFWMMGPYGSEDCEQVVVSMFQTYLGTPGDQGDKGLQCNGPKTAVLNIHITRNYPGGENPKAIPVADIMEASKMTALDSAVLSAGLQEISSMSDDYLGPNIIATVNVTPPNGMVQTTTLLLPMLMG